MDREENIEKLLHRIDRLCRELEHGVPPENIETDEIKRLVQVIRNSSQESPGG